MIWPRLALHDRADKAADAGELHEILPHERNGVTAGDRHPSCYSSYLPVGKVMGSG